MKKVAILGATGMLGSAVYAELKDKYELVLTVLEKGKIELLEKRFGGVGKHKVVEFNAGFLYKDFEVKKGYRSPHLKNLLDELDSPDYVINAIGITIPFSLKDPALTFFINSAWPHILAGELGPKLVHITTDCVFNGLEGYPYDENSQKTPVDIYGLSKSLGEPTNCLTLRTSVVGRELEGFTGLLEWFLQQKGRTVTGFANHFWNGITTKQFGKVCDAIISHPEKYPKTGLYHIFSTTVSKYDMLAKFRGRFNIDCGIRKDETQKLNRTLKTVHDLNSKLGIPSFGDMLREI